jgi:hypothetical protein
MPPLAEELDELVGADRLPGLKSHVSRGGSNTSRLLEETWGPVKSREEGVHGLAQRQIAFAGADEERTSFRRRQLACSVEDLFFAHVPSPE